MDGEREEEEEMEEGKEKRACTCHPASIGDDIGWKWRVLGKCV